MALAASYPSDRSARVAARWKRYAPFTVAGRDDLKALER